MSRRFGCPICDCRIDSLERGSFMCTFSGDQQVSSLAKSIQVLCDCHSLCACTLGFFVFFMCTLLGGGGHQQISNL
eukprot:1149862-Pelagomonas_calceolata.AAC.1